MAQPPVPPHSRRRRKTLGHYEISLAIHLVRFVNHIIRRRRGRASLSTNLSRVVPLNTRRHFHRIRLIIKLLHLHRNLLLLIHLRGQQVSPRFLHIQLVISNRLSPLPGLQIKFRVLHLRNLRETSLTPLNIIINRFSVLSGGSIFLSIERRKGVPRQ